MAVHNPDVFTYGVGQTFLLGIATAVLALVAAVFMKDITLRRTTGAEVPAPAEQDRTKDPSFQASCGFSAPPRLSVETSRASSRVRS